ncbi:hypothetical protein M8A51_18125 [Schlegelella sp. S2-27]|uniref:Type III secretion protein (HrpB7) n=1 Tax=Caldimonas mangrovi TaxID=2944811 RepID=A0ABT0YSQ3_9BURK|nr:hypothetical protein [Caldimonas mangrovi]MCM5681449.1 hypothetical protein [Caldimonas mangrovi]
MANPLRAFDMLLRIKRRRIEQHEAAAAEKAQQVKACEEACAQALQQEQACRADEQGCLDKIEQTMTAPEGFRPDRLITLRHVLDTLAEHTRRAQAQRQQAEQQLQAEQQALQEIRHSIRKAEQQYEKLQERRKELAQRIELAQEDVQDEDSEEAAVARLIGAARDELAALGDRLP